MNYVLLVIVSLVILFFWVRQRKIHSRIPCGRCGEIGNTISYFNLSTDATRDYCKVFGDFLYKKPLNFCFRCVIAHDSFLRELIMLSIEKRQNFGRNDQIQEAEKIWGNRAIEMLALLEVARGSMESARRILTEEEFKKVKPWIEKILGKST